jgi:hypothetical protein
LFHVVILNAVKDGGFRVQVQHFRKEEMVAYG